MSGQIEERRVAIHCPLYGREGCTAQVRRWDLDRGSVNAEAAEWSPISQRHLVAYSSLQIFLAIRPHHPEAIMAPKRL